MISRCFLSLVVCCVTLTSLDVQAGGPAKFMMLTQIDGQALEGQPLEWNDTSMVLLARDGQLHEFDHRKAKKSKKTGPAFHSYSFNEMQERLRSEFGSGFQVTATQHFVVVHPRGEWRAWADRLELLYRSFTRSMQVRGYRIREPLVPLVAVVFLNQSEYYRHAAANGTKLGPGTLGHYDGKTNRIFLFDAASTSGEDWSVNAETIIHEATHQTAYNVGVHQRFAEQPRWLVEGLALMFEARGVWDGRSTYTQADRINYGRLHDFRHYHSSRPSGIIKSLVSSDQMFRTSPAFAYAESWALSFFLCETQPQQYSRYLATVAARKAFQDYPARDRMADFMSVFGSDFDLLEAQLWRFVEELR